MKTMLRNLRQKSGMTKVEVAKKIGISPKSLYNYEFGKSPIPSNVLIKFVKLYGVSADYILGIKDFTTITFTNNTGEALAVISQNEIIEHTGYKVILSVD